jgi:cupin 2 domain-containing protein
MKKEFKGNIYCGIPSEMPSEIVENILENNKTRIERIISKGHNSPEDFWYDQAENEWVIVLQGQAKILFKGCDGPVLLAEGDYINIPKHVKHRVEWTKPNTETIWLAVFY